MQRIVTILDTALTVNYNDRPISTQKDLDTYKFEFDDSWQGYVKTAVFYTDPAMVKHLLIPEDGVVTIPWEILTGKPQVLYIGVFGTMDTKVKPTTFGAVRLREGSYIDGIAPLPPTPDVYQQIIGAWEDAKTEEEVRVTNENSRKNSFDALVDEYNLMKAALQQEITDGTASVDALQVLENQYKAKALALETTYAPRLGSVESQLAETTKKIKPDLYNKATMVIIDDDCSDKILTLLKPILDAKGVKATFALPSASVDTVGKLSKAQIDQLIAEGFEFAVHGKNGIDLNDATEADILADIVPCQDYFKANNMVNSDVLIYSNGLRIDNTRVKNIVKQYFSYGVTSYQNLNYEKPFDTYAIPRIDAVALNLVQLKAEIDRSVIYDGTTVLMTHCWLPAFDGQKIADLIDYAVSKGVEIIKLSEMLERKGNVLSLGEYTDPYSFYVSKDGKVKFNGTYVFDATKLMDDSMDLYKPNSITSVALTNDKDTYMATGGTMVVYNMGGVYGFALFYPNGDGKGMLKRAWDSSVSSWKPWDKVDKLIVDSSQYYNMDVALTSFLKSTVTYRTISAGNDYITNRGGMLTTFRMANDAFGYQTFVPLATNLMYMRRWSTTVWGTFAKVNVVSGTTTVRQAVLASSLTVGESYFDTTLSKPLWVKSVNPTVWVDAMGTVVA